MRENKELTITYSPDIWDVVEPLIITGMAVVFSHIVALYTKMDPWGPVMVLLFFIALALISPLRIDYRYVRKEDDA